MKKLIVSFLIALAPVTVLAAGGGNVHLDHADVDVSDKASMQRGAKYFMNYCMGCHSLEHGRYNRVARDLGIPEDLFTENLIFTDAKFGDLMENAIPAKTAKQWFGATPPDLTLLVRLKGGPDWLYTYLRGFYQDESRPWGVNNSVFKDVGMPHVMMELGGLCAEKPEPAETRIDPLTGEQIGAGGCSSYAVEGSMTPEEFDQASLDLVNFLTYMGEPNQLARMRLGWMVLAFLVILYAVSFLYTRELKKDIH